MRLLPLRVAIECSFLDQSQKEMYSLARQIVRAYGYNRKVASPLLLYLAGLDKADPRMLPPLEHRKKWTLCKQVGPSAEEYFDPAQIIYLSPDATQPLLLPDPNHVYVVGGIVDRTRKAHITYSRAKQSGVQMRRLPIRECAPISNVDPILSVVSVIQALALVNSGVTWGKAFEECIPQRYVKRREHEKLKQGE